MDFSSDSIATMGLRHVIEDAIQGLRQNGNDERAKFALNRLHNILMSASRGAEMATPAWHQMRSGDMSALEMYTKLFRYLSAAYEDTLTSRIAEASNVIKNKLSGDSIEPELASSTDEFLKTFLEKVRRDERFKQQSEPRIWQVKKNAFR